MGALERAGRRLLGVYFGHGLTQPGLQPMIRSMASNLESLEFERFHRRELQKRLAAGHGRLAHDLAKRLGSLGIQLGDGRSVTYTADSGGIAIEAGTEQADTVIEFDHDTWLSFAQDLETGPGLLYTGRGKIVSGKGTSFLGWESVWRAMYHGRPVFDPPESASENLKDRSGNRLNLGQSFTPESELSEMVHFMRETGFMLVRGVFDASEVAAFWQASEILKQQAREGDGSSWWGKTASGEAVLTRVLDGSVHPTFRGLEKDSRIARLLAAVSPELVPNLDAGDFASVLYKNSDVVEGLSDLPWHRDCGMGGHAIMCPTINVSIFLSEANDATGALKVLPGSHKGSVPFMEANHEKSPAGIEVDGKPGDVSLHFGDVMHVAPPPTGSGPYRRSVVLTWKPRNAEPHTGQRHYNDVLLENSVDGQVAHIDEVLRKT